MKILAAYKKDPNIDKQLMVTANFVNFLTINAFITNAKKGRRTIGATFAIE
ncbi:MAG: hypothetical protein Fur0010_04780 [Bdellovibrio sp.]